MIYKYFLPFHGLLSYSIDYVLWCTEVFNFNVVQFISSYFLKKILFIFRERGKEGEREGDKHQCVIASCVSPTGDLAHNPGMCPDWELNQRPFGLQAGAQSTETHKPRHISFYFYCLYFGVISKKSLPNPMPWSFPPMFSSKSFIVLGFTLRSWIHFELTSFFHM